MEVVGKIECGSERGQRPVIAESPPDNCRQKLQIDLFIQIKLFLDKALFILVIKVGPLFG